MTFPEWLVLACGGLLVAAAVVLAWLAVHSPLDDHGRTHVLFCPRFQKVVQCRLVRNPHTGEWTQVLACSLVQGRDEPRCDQECRAVLNRLAR